MRRKLRLEERSVPEPNTGCWVWLGNLDSEGRARYGQQFVGRLLILGDRADKRPVLHRCGHRWCVNPEHLALGKGRRGAWEVRRGRLR